MATKYVRASGGSDAADGTTFANGWATLQYAFDQAANWDDLVICGDFTISATVDVDAVAGTLDAPKRVRGADASGNLHAGAAQTTITTTTNGLTNGLIGMGATNSDYYYWYDLKFDGGGSGKATNGWRSATNDAADYCQFFNCRFTNASGAGFYCANNARYQFVDCEFDSNGKGGTAQGYYTANTRGHNDFYNCTFHDNTGTGATSNVSQSAFWFCLFYDNSTDGMLIGGNASWHTFLNCVFALNDGDGLEFASGSYVTTLMNNIFSSNGNYGIRSTSRDADSFTVAWRNNHFYNNTSGKYSEGTPLGTYTEGDPKFISTTDGSENFGLQKDSPCIAAAYNSFPTGGTGYLDIGAVQRREYLPAAGVVKSGETYGGESGTDYTGTYVATGGGGVPVFGGRAVRRA